MTTAGIPNDNTEITSRPIHLFEILEQNRTPVPHCPNRYQKLSELEERLSSDPDVVPLMILLAVLSTPDV